MFENTPVKYVKIWKPLPTENLLHDTDGVCYGRRFKGDKATPSATSRCGSLLPPAFCRRALLMMSSHSIFEGTSTNIVKPHTRLHR